MTTALEYRKSLYAAKYADVMQHLTKDNVDTYLEDILNILCIPYDIICHKVIDLSTTNTGKVSIRNGIIEPIYNTNFKFDFYQIKTTKGYMYGYSSTSMHIDVTKLLNLYEIAKLIHTTGGTNDSISADLYYIKTQRQRQPYYGFCDSDRTTIIMDLRPDKQLNNTTSIDKTYKYIQLEFYFDKIKVNNIDAIKAAMREAFCDSTAAMAIPYEPVATEVTKSDSNTSTPTAPLAEAEVVA